VNEELNQLLNKTLIAGNPGFFHLGKGRQCRRIAFNGSALVHDSDSKFHWFPCDSSFHSRLNGKLQTGLLETWAAGDRYPLQWLSNLTEFDTDGQARIGEILTFQEVLNSFLYCDDGFLFERSEEANQTVGFKLAARDLLDQIHHTQESMVKCNEALPCLDELPIRSAITKSKSEDGRNWINQQILNFVDGFRTFDQILKDSPFPAHITWRTLHEASLEGMILKQRFPEFSGVHPSSLDSNERKIMCQRLEDAVPMAASPVGLLELIAEIHRLENDTDNQLKTVMRIVEAHQAVRNVEDAIDVLDQYVEIDPDPESMQNLRQQMVIDHAMDLLSQGDVDRGRRWLRDAIDCTDDDQLRLALIGSYKDISLQIREGARIATKLYKSDQRRRALRLMDSLEALHPDNEEMQQIRVEFLIDHGEVEASEEALTRMAARLASEGRIQRARKVARSVARLRSEKNSRRPRWLPKITQYWPRFLLLLFFATVVSLVVITEARLQQLIVKAATIPPSDWREQARPWLLLLPEGPWKKGLHSAAELVADREQDMNQDYASKAKSLLARAQRDRRLGFHTRAQDQLSLAEQHGAMKEVRQMRESWKIEDEEAQILRKEADLASSKGDLEECHRLMRKLIEKYPSNDATAHSVFPVEIDSEPGTQVVFEGVSREVPTVIDIPPFKPIKIRLEKEGRKASYVITSDGPPRQFLPSPK